MSKRTPGFGLVTWKEGLAFAMGNGWRGWRMGAQDLQECTRCEGVLVVRPETPASDLT